MSDRGFARTERGAAAVEFAIVLPLLVLILFGIVEISIAMYDKAMITSASREGARFGGVFRPDPRPTCAEVYTAAIQNFQQGLIIFDERAGDRVIAHRCLTRPYDGTAGTWGAWAAGTCAHPDDQIAVETSFRYKFLFLPSFLNSPKLPFGGRFSTSWNLLSTTIMRCE